MSYKIIVDSCGELTDEMKASDCFETASLEIDVEDYHIVDDETFDQADFRYRRSPPARPRSVIWKGITVRRIMSMRLHCPLN